MQDGIKKIQDNLIDILKQASTSKGSTGFIVKTVLQGLKKKPPNMNFSPIVKVGDV